MKCFWVCGILFWGNAFSVVSRLRGVTSTIRLIGRIGGALPLTRGSVGAYSAAIDRLLRQVPLLFIARKQRCLVRGYLIYFFGKRRQLDIRLHFGSKQTVGGFDTHCWIEQGRRIRFELEEVISQYTRLIEYR